jgi:hypothetical protein
MTCKICTQLENAVMAARSPDSPDLLLGLTEPGLRNRARQREERQLKAEADLLKHQRSCSQQEQALDVPGAGSDELAASRPSPIDQH